MGALKYSTDVNDDRKLQLSWDPNRDFLDVLIEIYSCTPNQVQLTGFTTDMDGDCKSADYKTKYTYYAPQGGETFQKRYRLSCRKHAVNLELQDSNGNTTSSANAVAPLP